LGTEIVLIGTNESRLHELLIMKYCIHVIHAPDIQLICKMAE